MPRLDLLESTRNLHIPKDLAVGDRVREPVITIDKAQRIERWAS